MNVRSREIRCSMQQAWEKKREAWEWESERIFIITCIWWNQGRKTRRLIDILLSVCFVLSFSLSIPPSLFSPASLQMKEEEEPARWLSQAFSLPWRTCAVAIETRSGLLHPGRQNVWVWQVYEEVLRKGWVEVKRKEDWQGWEMKKQNCHSAKLSLCV